MYRLERNIKLSSDTGQKPTGKIEDYELYFRTHSTIDRTAMPLGPLAINGLFSSAQATPAMSR